MTQSSKPGPVVGTPRASTHDGLHDLAPEHCPRDRAHKGTYSGTHSPMQNGAPTHARHSVARDRRPAFLCSIVVLAALVAFALTIWVIRTQVGSGVWHALFAPDPANLRQLILHDSTLPRIAMTLICGASLALAGTLAQQVLRNPLAEPMTLGIFPGAYLALSLAALYAPSLLAAGREPVALAGGTIAILVVFALAWRQRLASLPVILSGMIVSLYCGSVSLALAISHFELLSGLMIWGGGALDQQGWHASLSLGSRCAIAAFAAYLLRRPLGVFEAGDTTARGLGVSLTRTRFAALAITVALTAGVVSTVGVIGFIGLASPAITRLAGARRFGQRLIWAPLLGAILLWLTDEAVQIVALSGVFGSQLVPTGAVTSLFGAPLLLWLLRTLKSRPDLDASHRDASDAPRRETPWPWIVGVAVMLVVAVWLSLFVRRGLDGWGLASIAQIRTLAFWYFPHLAAALSAGALLGLAGVMIQRVTRNPVASPDILGVSSGGGIGLIAAVFLFDAPGSIALFTSCVVGCGVTLSLILWFGRRASYAPERVLLIGIAIGALFQAISGVVTASGDERTALILNLVTGSTYYVQPALAQIGLAIAVIGVAISPWLARGLELLSLSDDVARSLGARVGTARLAILALIGVLTAASTLIVGPLSFVGLMAPHIARSAGIRRTRDQLLAATAIGALLMVLADWAGRIVLFPNELPAGLIAAMIGGPYLVWSLMKAHAQGPHR